MVNYKSTSYNNNFNLVLYMSLILAGLGIGWLSLNKVDAGIQYTTIFLVMSMLFLLGFLFIKEDDKSFMSKLIRIPFSTDYDLAIPLFLLGWLTPMLITFLVGLIGGSFNISQLMIPFYATDITAGISQSFAIAQLQADPFWSWFITIWVAGTIEEFAFGLASMFIFSLLAMFVLKMINDGKDLSFMKAETFYVTFALILSMLMFSGLHLLNSTYSGYMFLIAMIFRLFMNLGIYVWGLFISFTMGYHQSNNAIFYFKTYGADATLQAILSVKGLIIMLMFVLMIFYVLRRFPIISKKFSQYLGSLG